MRSFLLVLTASIAVLTAAVSAGQAVGAQARPSAPAGPAASVDAQRALLDRYCVTCHNERLQRGDLALDTVTLADISHEASANVNEMMQDGTSALVLAVINAHYDVAAMLLEKGADPNAATQGWTALHQVIMTRRPNKSGILPPPVPSGRLSELDLIETLLAHGADVNAVATKRARGNRSKGSTLGATPFFLAAKFVDLDVMRLLEANGADLDVTNEEGTTPFMAAAGVGIWRVGESPGTDEEALEADAPICQDTRFKRPG